MSRKSIKLVIWDLDDTFWAGTLSEGGGEAVGTNISCLRTLVDRGIMNSISSKNDSAKAMQRLKEMGVADLFVFPRINWEDKGPQVAAIIQDCNLRPENVLFIDDNARNLQEAAFHAEGLMTASPDIIPRLLEMPEAEGRPDPEHARLAQFRVLERKNEARRAYTSNDEFLRRSDVRVNLCTDCFAHVDRILELIDRTNQLNFTKKRIGKDALEKLLAAPAARNMYVTVKDAFGDYGIVGFVSLHGSECAHFLFSCRLIGLGVVEWVYAELGMPHLEVVGETAVPFPFTIRPDWINQPAKEESPVARKIRKVGLSVLLRGGCDLLQMEPYLKFRRLTCEFNHRRYHRDHTAFALDAYRYKGDPRLAEICENVPFLWKNTFDTGVYDSSYDVVVFSLLIDYIQAVYRHCSDAGLRLGYGVWMRPLSHENIEPFKAGELDWFLDNFLCTGRVSAQELKEDLEFIRGHMAPDVHLVLINGCEVAHENPLEPGTLAVHVELNKAIDEFVAAHGSNTHLLDMRKIVTRREQLTNNIRHYQRDVYWKMARELMDITAGIAEKKGKGTPPFLRRIWTMWKSILHLR